MQRDERDPRPQADDPSLDDQMDAQDELDDEDLEDVAGGWSGEGDGDGGG